MWEIIARLLSSTVLQPILGTAVDAYKAKLGADQDSNKILADVAAREMMVDQRQRELDAQIIVAEQGNWFTRTPRALVQWACAIYICKCIVWDMVLGLGTTPDVKSTLLANAFNLIIVMWFGGRSLEKIANTVVNRVKR